MKYQISTSTPSVTRVAFDTINEVADYAKKVAKNEFKTVFVYALKPNLFGDATEFATRYDELFITSKLTPMDFINEYPSAQYFFHVMPLQLKDKRGHAFYINQRQYTYSAMTEILLSQLAGVQNEQTKS